MSRIIERALSIINDNLKDQTTSFADPISIKPMARGGEVDKSETVRVYHGTNEKNYADIMRSKKIDGPAYFLANESDAKNYGDGEHVVTANIPVHKLKVDFDFPGGRLLDVDEANQYSKNYGWDIHDYLNHGHAVGIEEDHHFARGGRLLQDEYPTHYMPHVGRQVMADGGDADPISSALDVAQSIPETPMPSLRPTPPAPTVPSAEGRVGAPDRKTNEIGHYSSAAEAAYALKQSKGPASQMIGALKNMPGVKPEEIKWSGVEEAFDPKEMITKDDLVNHFNKKLPDVEETVLRKQSSYPYREADEWQEAIDTAERRRNFDEAERLQRAWEEYEGQGARTGIDSPPKFEQYSLPGGQNYREVLMHLPLDVSPKTQEARKLNQRIQSGEFNSLSDEDRMAKYAERDRLLREGKLAERDPYKSSHWGEPNVLGHLRMSDRTGPEGEKILHLEELQSDWGQTARKKGFKNMSAYDAANARIKEIQEEEKFIKDQYNQIAPQLSLDDLEGLLLNDPIAIERSNTVNKDIFDKMRPLEKRMEELQNERLRLADEMDKHRSGVPEAPYVGNTQHWADLGLKRALREAAEGGYDKMIWTPGAEQAARYDLSKHIDEIFYKGGNLIAYDPDGYKVIQQTGIPREQLSDYIGKEAAEKLLAQEKDKEGWHWLDSEGLKVGGEGMQSFYDKIVPTQLSKLIKKLDPKARIEMGGHTIDVGKGKPTEYRDFDEYTKAPDSRQIKAHVLHITPELRKKVLEGLPAYAQGGNVEGDKTKLAPGVEPVSEMENEASSNQTSPYAKENDLLQPIGQSKMVGDEDMLFDDGLYKAGVSSHAWNNKKSIRYLHHDEDGNPIGALQIMTHGPRTKKATIQNVYVAEDHRRKNIAANLLKRARRDFDVKHSQDLTAQGRAFAKATKAYGGAIIPGPKLTEDNADDFARRLITWTFATAPLFHRAAGGSVIDDPLDVLSKLRR